MAGLPLDRRSALNGGIWGVASVRIVEAMGVGV